MSGTGRGSVCSLVTATFECPPCAAPKTWINARLVSGRAADVRNTRRAKLNVQTNSLRPSLKDLLWLAFLREVSLPVALKAPNKTCGKMFLFFFSQEGSSSSREG